MSEQVYRSDTFSVPLVRIPSVLLVNTLFLPQRLMRKWPTTPSHVRAIPGSGMLLSPRRHLNAVGMHSQYWGTERGHARIKKTRASVRKTHRCCPDDFCEALAEHTKLGPQEPLELSRDSANEDIVVRRHFEPAAVPHIVYQVAERSRVSVNDDAPEK